VDRQLPIFLLDVHISYSKKFLCLRAALRTCSYRHKNTTDYTSLASQNVRRRAAQWDCAEHDLSRSLRSSSAAAPTSFQQGWLFV